MKVVVKTDVLNWSVNRRLNQFKIGDLSPLLTPRAYVLGVFFVMAREYFIQAERVLSIMVLRGSIFRRSKILFSTFALDGGRFFDLEARHF